MPDSVLLDTDPLTGRVRRFHALPDETFAITSAVDVEPVIEQNKDVASLQGTRWKDNENWVASIPMGIYMGLLKQWRTQGLSYAERQKALKRWLNASENRLFRVKAGRL